MHAPTFSDVLKAKAQIRPYLQPTPLFNYPDLSREVGAQVWVKHENHQPVGAFKVRGGVNLLSQMSEAERAGGVTAASTGNHGQSIAYAARLFGTRAVIYVPEKANPAKVESIEALGAQVVFHGRDFDEARSRCEEVAEQEGMRLIHSGNEPLLIAGVATATLEIVEAQPDIDVIIVPLGGGSGAAGACLVAKTVRPEIRVIAVQSEAAPAGYRSWKAHELVEDSMNTFAEGLATRSAFEMPQRILWDLLDDFVLVSDDEIRHAMVKMIDKTHNLVEAAGAASLAAAYKLREELKDQRVALICSGGNVSRAQLAEVMQLP